LHPLAEFGYHVDVEQYFYPLLAGTFPDGQLHRIRPDIYDGLFHLSAPLCLDQTPVFFRRRSRVVALIFITVFLIYISLFVRYIIDKNRRNYNG